MGGWGGGWRLCPNLVRLNSRWELRRRGSLLPDSTRKRGGPSRWRQWRGRKEGLTAAIWVPLTSAPGATRLQRARSPPVGMEWGAGPAGGSGAAEEPPPPPPRQGGAGAVSVVVRALVPAAARRDDVQLEARPPPHRRPVTWGAASRDPRVPEPDFSRLRKNRGGTPQAGLRRPEPGRGYRPPHLGNWRRRRFSPRLRNRAG